jgi:hypothetical protein
MGRREDIQGRLLNLGEEKRDLERELNSLPPGPVDPEVAAKKDEPEYAVKTPFNPPAVKKEAPAAVTASEPDPGPATPPAPKKKKGRK